MRCFRSSKSLSPPMNSLTPQNPLSACEEKTLDFRKRNSRAVGRRASSYQPGILIRPFASRRVMRACISRHAGFGAIAAYDECWSTDAVRLTIDVQDALAAEFDLRRALMEVVAPLDRRAVRLQDLFVRVDEQGEVRAPNLLLAFDDELQVDRRSAFDG